MNGWTAALLGVLLAVNPPAVALTWLPQLPERRAQAFRALAVGLVVLWAAALLSGPVLDGLNITIPTYRLAASAVLGFTGVRWMLTTKTELTEPVAAGVGGTAVLALALLTPAPVLVALSAGADGGVVAALVSIAVAIAVTLALTTTTPPRWLLQALTRLLGAAALATAVATGLDAARTV